MKLIQKIISVFLIAILMFSGINIKASAADEQTTTITVGPFQDNLEHDYTFKLPELESITSITSDTGSVKVKSTDGENVTVTVSGGDMKDSQEVTKDIVIDLKIPDTMESLQIDDSSQMTNHSKIPADYTPKIISGGHYPRNENWYRWSEDPLKPGTFRWTTDRYEEIEITNEAEKVISQWTSKPGEYVDAEGYKVSYSEFDKTNKSEWYKGYITSNGTQAYEPPYTPSSEKDSTLAGYMYIKVCTYNYTAHVHATGKKSVGSGYTYKLTVTYKGKPAAPVDNNNPPIARINAPSVVVLGDDVFISGMGIDPDGDPLTYDWYYSPEEGVNGELKDRGSMMWFDKLGDFNFDLVVTDDKGASGADSKVIKVVEPVPVVNIQYAGTLKENRKIVIDATSSTGGSKRYPVDWSKAIWSVSAVSGGTNQDTRIQTHTEGSTDGTILVDSSKGINNSLNTLQKFDMLFKKPGVYKLSCTVTNTYGNSSYEEITLNVVKDEAPVANFATPSVIYRDPNNNAPNGYAQASIDFTDDGTPQNGSYSKDGDIIAKRAYIVCFDSNNNGDSSNEMSYMYCEDYNGTNQIPWNYSLNTFWKPYVLFKDFNPMDINNYNTGNLNNVKFLSTHVGKFKVAEIVLEEYGQDTIPQFITKQDKRYSFIIK